jgi:hypothetical protein
MIFLGLEAQGVQVGEKSTGPFLLFLIKKIKMFSLTGLLGRNIYFITASAN